MSLPEQFGHMFPRLEYWVVDTLTALLEGPRARGAFLLRSVLEPPWSVRVEDRAPLTLLAMIRGDGWLCPDAVQPAPLQPGDVAILSGPDAYTVADDPDTPPRAVIHPGQQSTTPDGQSLCDTMDLGVRTWGDRPDGSTIMLTGTYQLDSEISQRLLRALPASLVVSRDELDCPFPGLLADEVVKDAPGQEVVLDRLLDLLLIATLRTWFSRRESAAPAWYRAQSEPVVGPALQLLHANPAHPWTVGELATRVGVSRAGLARRFTELIGEPPMSYLAGWRLALAADLLREPDLTLDAIAHRVGYGGAFALSTAFKRVRGVSPREHRLAAEPQARLPG
jgi:AraC-like DNA-binding protein